MKVNHDEAVEIVKAGLQSGAISLRGSKACPSDQVAKEIGKLDGAYLNALVNELTEGALPYR